MKTIFSKALQFTLLGLLFACAPLEEAEEIAQLETQIQEKSFEIDEKLVPTHLSGSFITGNEKRLEGPFSKDKCGCNFISEVSDNLVGKGWSTYFTTTVNGQFVNITTWGIWNLPNPRIIYYDDVLTNQQVEITMFMNYLVGEPLLEDGWIKTKVACEKAPPIVYYMKVPSMQNAGADQLEIRKYGRITKDCGTIKTGTPSAD